MNEIMTLIHQMSTTLYWSWFGLALLLIIFEVILGTNFFLLCLGLVAFGVGIVAWALPALHWHYQVLIFALGSIASIGLWRMYFKSNPVTSDRPTLNRRAEQYIGRTFILSEAIVNNRGKIVVDDSTWRVEGDDLPLGANVKVIGVDGVILKVKESPVGSGR